MAKAPDAMKELEVIMERKDIDQLNRLAETKLYVIFDPITEVLDKLSLLQIQVVKKCSKLN